MTKDGPRYFAAPDPDNPGHWRVKDLVTGQLTGRVLKSKSVAQRNARRMNQGEEGRGER